MRFNDPVTRLTRVEQSSALLSSPKSSRLTAASTLERQATTGNSSFFTRHFYTYAHQSADIATLEGGPPGSADARFASCRFCVVAIVGTQYQV